MAHARYRAPGSLHPRIRSMKFFKKAAELVISTALVAVSAVNKLLQHRRAGTVFRTVSALMFTVMAVGLFPAASEVALLTADDKNDAVAVGKVEPLRIYVVYRDNAGSEWALTAARRLASELAQRYNYEAELVPASDIENGKFTDDGGAIVIGHTELSECDYVDSYYSVGADCCRTYFNSRGDLIIESFGSAGAEAGIDRFVSNYNGDAINAVRMKKGVGVPDLDAVLSGFENNSTEDPSASAYIEIKAPEGSGGFSMLVLSSPDADRYSVRAIGALLDSEKPGMVVFCGDLSAGAEDRASLAEAWDAIIAPLNERGISWSFLPKAVTEGDGGGLPGSMINEVLGTREGCVAPTGSTSLLMLSDAKGKTVGSVWMTGEGAAETSEKLSAELEKGREALGETDGDVPGALIAADLPEFVASEGTGETSGASVFDTAVSEGITCFVAASSEGRTDSVSSGSITCVFAGSVGYSKNGLGGRFEYNNSMRGGVLLTLVPQSGERKSYFNAEYVYTADLGMNSR